MSSNTAPAGIDLSQNLAGSILGADISLFIVATIAVGLRFLARWISKAKYWWDDWTLLLALVFACGNTIMSIIATQHGIGKHLWAPGVNLVVVLKLLWAYEFCYATVVTATRISFVLLYYRIFPTPWFRLVLHITTFLVLGWWIAIVITAAVQCRPYSYFWAQYIDPASQGKCIDLYIFFLTNGSLSVVTDFILLICPIPVILKLQMPASQKWTLLSIFTLASFACVAGIVRVYFITYQQHSNDITWNFSVGFIWSSVEPCVGIVCACLPSLRPLIRKVLPRVFKSGQSSTTPNSRSREFYPLKNTPAHAKLREDDEVHLTNNVSVSSQSETPDKSRVYIEREIEWSDSCLPSTSQDMGKI